MVVSVCGVAVTVRGTPRMGGRDGWSMGEV